MDEKSQVEVEISVVHTDFTERVARQADVDFDVDEEMKVSGTFKEIAEFVDMMSERAQSISETVDTIKRDIRGERDMHEQTAMHIIHDSATMR